MYPKKLIEKQQISVGNKNIIKKGNENWAYET